VEVKRLLLLFSILFLFFIQFANCAYAWTLVDIRGDWVYIDKGHWQKDGWNEGYAEWNHSLTGFNGYYIKINTTTWENYREWWQFGVLSIGETWCDFWIKIKIETDQDDVWVITQMHGWTGWFGLVNQFNLKIGASTNADDWNDIEVRNPDFSSYGWSLSYWNPDDFEIFIFNEGGKIKVNWFIHVPDQTKRYLASKEFDGTLGSNATVTLIYQHAGQGKVEGYAYDSFTLPNFPPYETKGKGGGWWNWIGVLSTLDWGAMISTLFACVTIFFSFVKLSLPLLGVFAFLWIIDCIASAVVYGEPRIVGDMMMKIYDFLRGVWQTLVNIANAIWDFITFWS